MCNKKAMLEVDFMAYAKKVLVKKAKLKTYGNMARHLWKTFTKLASNYARKNITFDLYITCSIKETKQNRRNGSTGISTNNLGQNNNFLLTQTCFGQ